MKRIFVGILLASIVLGILPLSASAADSRFTDVPPDAWYADAAAFVQSEGLMLGVGQNRFDPESEVTRAMVPTVLWRMEGSPVAEAYNPIFLDVTPNEDWYGCAVTWAAENGIVNGYALPPSDAPTGIFYYFAPNQAITREELATILYRYAKSLDSDTSRRDDAFSNAEHADLSAFPDAAKVSEYAKEAMAWANGAGLILGDGDNGTVFLNPQANATRAQMAVILMRFANYFRTI